MYDWLRNLLLRVLRVPPEPQPPAGAPESVRVFRAGRNYLRLRLGIWAAAQSAALVGIIFWFWALHRVVAERELGRQLAESAAAEAASAPESPSVEPAETKPADPSSGRRKKRGPKRSVSDNMRRAAAQVPDWVFPLLWALKLGGVAVYLVQLPVTYTIRRLDYEQRWYVVTDRSLRLRSGVWSVREMTMSFANLQQVVVSQGPLERLLGLADVRVQSAGGGGVSHGQHAHAQHSLHTGLFHAVDNAEAIRDLITERLRKFRETGLGDPDEKRHVVPSVAPSTTDSAALAAAKELLAEARVLRQVLR